MGKPYTAEMSKLADTFASVMATDITQLRCAVKTAGLSPLLAIGSGGSLTAAHALASLHRRLTGHMSAVATPLEGIAESLSPQIAVWLVSAGGRNVDILTALRTLASREPRQLAILCGQPDSPLVRAARTHSYVDRLVYEPPTGKDGFLATNSLLGFVTLLTRAYAAEFSDEGCDTHDFVQSVRGILVEEGEVCAAWRTATGPLWARGTTLVLHGVETRLGAIDLESKFTEAALGHLQIADYRNFAHGRHHWLAQRADTTGVLAFISPETQLLAERTLALIPNDVPQARLSFDGPPEAAALASLVAAFRITGWAGQARSIDPGRPSVPEFGRKLFRLHLPKDRIASRGARIDDRDTVAIERKAGLPLARLARRGNLEAWRAALMGFREQLLGARFAALVLDYDGTMVDTRERTAPPRTEIATELTRLLEAGMRLAVATGRGVSVRRDLRQCLPEQLWPHVLVGYYNGADLGMLADSDAPDRSDTVCPALKSLAVALREQSELADVAVQTDRRFQITLEAKRPVPENRLWDLAHEVVLMQGGRETTITRSSHSVDILAPGVSKLNVISRLRKFIDTAPILTVGDRGRWPGNDYDLLREPFALSVDEISVDPKTCWNLARRGQRGVAVTLSYLRALKVDRGGMHFDEAAIR